MKMLSRIEKKIQRPFAKIIARLFSGDLIERLAVGLLLRVYDSKFNNDWIYSKAAPHFYNQRIGVSRFAFGTQKLGARSFNRGFFVSQVIQEGDRLLDIGCGGGFFTRRFYAGKCKQIDAIDIEPSAILAAQKYNNAEYIKYQIMDATTQPFPNSIYDIIVWDGAIGHFPPMAIDGMLNKIIANLSKKGVFVGSESVGEEGDDHLTRFETLEDFGKLFHQYFKFVQLYAEKYKLNDNFIRHEAYWRCSNSPIRIKESNWIDFD